MDSSEHDTLLIGCGAGFGGDRADAAGPVVDTLIARGKPAALIFEMLGERTLALAQLERLSDPQAGYSRLMEGALKPVLRRCVEHQIPIIGNFGAANPRGAALRIQQMARELGLPSLAVAVVHGDDLSNHQALVREYLDPAHAEREFVSANVYLGAGEIAAALAAGARVVVTGRVADPSLALGPAMAHFGWSDNDWDILGRATMAGHLLECGAQVSGGYFADPGFKDVPDVHHVGFPVAEIAADGSCVIGKADQTGGLVDARTVKEQLLYEVHDPAAYLTPDVVADISQARVQELAPNRVVLRGVCGHPRPETLKVTVCFATGWLGEAEISYAGHNAEARARLAAEIVKRRIGDDLALRVDLIGVLSVFGDDGGRALAALADSGGRDVRLRVAAAHGERDRVQRLLDEVTALYTCGPAAGGGVRAHITRRLGSSSCLVPRDAIEAGFSLLD